MHLAVGLLLFLALVNVGHCQMLNFALTGGERCVKNADCRDNQECRMYDFYQYPAMWPPCPHVGYCACVDGFVKIANSSCVTVLQLNLGDRCTNQAYEIIRKPEMRCDGNRVICNSPAYIQRGAFCEPTPIPSDAFTPQPVTRPDNSNPCVPVSFLAPCDRSTSCCDSSKGLTCQNKGFGTEYQQCDCYDSHHTYDSVLGYCRPRIYGDICQTDEDCNTGLISSQGFECRVSRCRCKKGYEPHDTLFWNETTLSTEKRRICVWGGALTWVPTGQSCTTNPHKAGTSNATRLCHPQAFCHNCYSDRQLAASGQAGLIGQGVCRELACIGDQECGFQGSCNRWSQFIDPPCERGMCDCHWNTGFWKNRFSRCSPMRQLWLGDRCITAKNGLHIWYPNNENWDKTMECVPDSTLTGGTYAGYAWGTLKCKLPLVEDFNGNCVRNDNTEGTLLTVLSYNEACDDDDRRWNRRVCDTSKNLKCINKICQCSTSLDCSISFGRCLTATSTAPSFWDGTQCRTRRYGDQCETSTECCGGQCLNGQCNCPTSSYPVDIGSHVINNGDDPNMAAVKTSRTCLRNFTVVAKGAKCHVDPVAWDCKESKIYGWKSDNFLPTLVCAPGLVCLRCPADFSPDDESIGFCRSVTPIRLPTGSCGRVEMTEYATDGPLGTYRNGMYPERSSSSSTSLSHFLFLALLFVISTIQI